MENKNALAPGVMLRQYRIDRVIGQGGFGITYLAFDTDLQRRVAIKECFPRDFVSREGTTIVPTGSKEKQSFSWALGKFVGEATTLARFKHPGIVQVLQILKKENDSAYMVLEFVDGISFDKWLKSLNGKLDEALLKSVISPILDALEVVHDNGIAHLDIAPDNIYIRGNGDAVLLDFGAAKQTIGQQTRTLNLVVKDGYSSPEQYYVEGRKGSWSDVYAFAATLYRAVAGKRPIDAMARLDAINNDEQDPLEPLASKSREGFSKEFLSAIDHGMSAKSKARPQTIKEWRKTIIGDAISSPEKSTPIDNASKSQKHAQLKSKPRKKSKTAFTLIAASLVAAAVVIGGVLYNQQNLIQTEEAEWNSVVKLDSRSAYDTFITKYPNSTRLAIAKQAIRALQEPWTKSFNSAASEQSNAVTANDDTIVIAGSNASSGNNGFQAFIKAISLSGRLRWHIEYGGTGNEVFEDVILLNNGDVIAVGHSRQTPSSQSKALVVRFSKSGEKIWAKQLGDNGESAFNAISFLRNGNLVAVGNTGGKGVTDGWVVKLDSNGNVINETTIDGDGKNSFTDVEEMSDGTLAFVGYKQRPGGSDPNFWLVKTTADGKILIDRNPGGHGTDQFHALAATSSGELIIVGDTTSFGTNSVDGMIMKLTRNDKLPPKPIANAKDDFLTDVKVATDGGVIIVGYTSSKGAGKTDGWITKFNSSLTEVIWERTIGSKGVEKIHGLHIMDNGSIIMVGSSQKNGTDNSNVWALRLGSRGQYDGS